MVKDKRLIGRKDEQNEMDRVMESDRSEFVIVYDRRRVGKTFLVDRYFTNYTMLCSAIPTYILIW